MLRCALGDRVGLTGLRPSALPHHRTCGFPHPAVEEGDRSWSGRQVSCIAFFHKSRRHPGLALHSAPSSGLHPSSNRLRRSGVATAVVTPRRFAEPARLAPSSPFSSYSLLLRPFAPPGFPGFFATTASADFSPALTNEISPGKVLALSPRAARLYRAPFGSLRASLYLASSPRTHGLTVCSCTCGRRFACRFFQPYLADRTLRFGYGCRCRPRQLPFKLQAQAHAGHTRVRSAHHFLRHWRGQPRPMNGIFVAMTVMDCTFASSGRPAM